MFDTYKKVGLSESNYQNMYTFATKAIDRFLQHTNDTTQN